MFFEQVRSAWKLHLVAAMLGVLMIVWPMMSRTGPPHVTKASAFMETVAARPAVSVTNPEIAPVRTVSLAPKPVETYEAAQGGRPSRQAIDNWENNPFPYLYQVEVVATGYFAGKESTGKGPGHPQYGITYSGVKVRKDTFSTIAADPAVFPIGTILFIPEYGYGVVADTGSAIKGNKIDLYFDTKDQIYELWGKRKVKVNVLARGSGKLTEAMLNRLNQIESASAKPYP